MTGMGDDGTLHEDIPGALLDFEGQANDLQTSVFVLAGPPLELPQFTTRATGEGPVGFIFTDADEIEHPFMFDVSPGDTSRFVNQNGIWRLLVDRGGDGTIEQSVDLGAPSADFVGPTSVTRGRSVTLAARLRGEDVTGSYAWTVAGPASITGTGPEATLTGVQAPATVTVTLTVTTSSGGVATYSRPITVERPPPYQPAGVDCLDEPGHVVLPPVDADGSSVFKAGRTVPVKFRVCDTDGSVGVPGIVTSFALVRTVSGTTVSDVTETPSSTTPDSSFRWDPTDQQWIFNLSTKGLAADTTYTYEIALDDGSTIELTFGLR